MAHRSDDAGNETVPSVLVLSARVGAGLAAPGAGRIDDAPICCMHSTAQQPVPASEATRVVLGDGDAYVAVKVCFRDVLFAVA